MKLDQNPDLQQGQANHFGYTGTRIETLGASEYTLVSIVTDKTGSISKFAPDLLETQKSIIAACKRSPRADFLMVRRTEFNESIDEVQGFMELFKVDTNTMKVPTCTGGTALFDATLAAISVSNAYAKELADNEFFVNAVVFVITDGDDNYSKFSAKQVKEELQKGITAEYLESINVILIGINDSQFKHELESFKKDAGLTQYVPVGELDPDGKKLAKLADFVSKSISSQSLSLGTGGPSNIFTF